MSEGRDIIEPAQWPQRNDKRVPVLDMNFDPPRVVRYVGWRPCTCCGRKFFSRDVAGAVSYTHLDVYKRQAQRNHQLRA